MKKTGLTFFFYLLSLFAAFPVYFKHIGIREGLSQLTVMSVYQDELGRMWFGTLEGISVYDGFRTVAFRPADLAADSVFMGNDNYPVTGDRNGSVFFRSDRSLLRYDMHRQTFECVREHDVEALASCNGQVWAVMADSLFRWDTAGQAWRFAFAVQLPEPGTIQKLHIAADSVYWIGTNNGLYVSRQGAPVQCLIPHEDIYDFFPDSWGNLWIGTRLNGLYLRRPTGEMEHWKHHPRDPHTVSSNQVRCFTEDNLGNIWIGTFTGLNKYDPVTGRFTFYTKDVLPGSLTHPSVFALYKDMQGSVWAGTYYGGVHYFNPETDIFTYYPENPSRDNCLSYSFIGNMAEDRDGNVWICTEGGGLNRFDRENRTFEHFYSGVPGSGRIAHNNLKSICYSAARHTLYIGTHRGGLSIYDIAARKFRNPYYESAGYAALAGDVVNVVRLYRDKYLILLTQKGAFRYELETGRVVPFLKGRLGGVTSLLVDSADNLWFTQGARILKVNPALSDSIATYTNAAVAASHFSFSCLYEYPDGRIFCGSLGAGLFSLDPRTGRFTQYTAGNDLLQSDYCYAITRSVQGYLVISGNKGITFFNPDTRIVKAVDLGTGLPVTGINNGCGLLVCRDGEIFVGGTDGAASFFEHELFASAKDYRLYFSGLSVNNEPVSPRDNPGVLPEALPFTKAVRLNHRQNDLTVTFTSNNYVNTLKKTSYEYKLDGFDTKWIYTDAREVTYTNLSPGSYTLLVREKQYDPAVTPQTIRLGITVCSPWYATPWAYGLYAVLTVGVIAGFIRFKQSQWMLRNSLALERKEKEKIEELNQAKLQFFSNISHEFRTPLTLIISQTELLLQANSLAPSFYNKILKIHRNTRQLRMLITELLDFRKLEQGHVTLKVSERNLVPFLKEIYLSFYEYAGTQGIRYRFTCEPGEIPCWFDARQMQKVFYNLLSNAFKYSRPGGSVEMVVGETESGIVVKVIDNGIGIAKEAVDKVFDRFYQAADSVSDVPVTAGTGIGLSLTKSIVELHHGRISVESTPGYGSIFSVTLQKGCAHFAGDASAVLAKEQGEEQETASFVSPALLPEPAGEPELPESTELPGTDTGNKRRILLVEDNEELLQVLSALFAPYYRVTVARNGEEGLAGAQACRPDLIVSDVMMPVMSGTEMCLKIKGRFDLCHIPVVLLTALTSVEQNIEGLNRGADDYITKPFNARLLVARCNNLVRNRIILQKKFGRQEDFDTHSLAGNPLDQQFLDTVQAIIEKNADNLDFDINLLAREVGVSRSSLYGKFKALTGLTPNDFVQNWKLKKAARWLKSNPELQIADISDRLGFGSPRYFSRCFKAQFEVTPMEYRKKHASPGGVRKE